MNAKGARSSQNHETKSQSKLHQYARLAQFEAVRSGDRKSCLDVLHHAEQRKSFEIDFSEIKSLADVRQIEHQILNLLLRGEFSVQKANFYLKRLTEIGEDISYHERETESQKRRKKEMADEREMFRAKLKHFNSLDARERTLYLALNHNFNVLFQAHQNRALRKLSKTHVLQKEEMSTKPSVTTSSNPTAAKPRRQAHAKVNSKLSQTQNVSNLARLPTAAAPSKSSTIGSSEKIPEFSLAQSALATTDETELRPPRITNESFKYIPSPFSLPRKGR